MTQNNNSSAGITACSIVCWLLALACGVFAASALIGWTGIHGLVAAVIGLIIMLIAGWLLNAMFCNEEVSTGAVTTAAATTTAAAAVGTTAVTSSTSSAEKAPEAKKVDAPKSAPAKKPAAKKTAAKSTASAKAKSAPASKPAAAKKTAAKSTAAKSAPAAKPAAAKKAAAKSTTTAKAKSAPASKPAAAKKPAAKKPAAAKFYTKAPAKVDDLKLISGVGPKLEKTLNEIGVYQYAQVAVWKKAEIKKVDDQLKFKGRIERDDWMKQAKILAKGGETEFSKKKRKK